MRTGFFFFIGLCLLSGSPARGGELLPLAGDGVQDDTAAIQQRIDSGDTLVYLPPPKRHYLISRTLRIGSNTELKLDRNSVIRLAPKSDCPMIENRSYRNGADSRIALTGGVWDMANLDQSPNPGAYWWYRPPRRCPYPPRHEYGYFMGMAMRFANVTNMSVSGVTIRNPTTYGMAFCKVSYFRIDDITFDYKTVNPFEANLDGVHLDGNCHFGRISNLFGMCFDDMVALNADDIACAQEVGPISDITVDGLYAGYCHSAVRLLSAPHDVRRVVIRNVHGAFFCYAVGLTHYFEKKPRGTFDEIVVEDVFMTKAFSPKSIGVMGRAEYNPIYIEGPVDVGSLVISRFFRDEKAIAVPTIGLDAKATVSNLVIRDSKLVSHLAEPVRFLDLRGRVGELKIENLQLGENCARE